jgi:hypothetical protein
MKIRLGFVSNSSSSSFIINKEFLSPNQIQIIKDHWKAVTEGSDDAWDITESDTSINGYTFMDNFDMHYYLEDNGIDMSHVRWSDYPYTDWDFDTKETEWKD